MRISVNRGSSELYQAVKTYHERFFARGSSTLAATMVDAFGVHHLNKKRSKSYVSNSTNPGPTATAVDTTVDVVVKDKKTGEIGMVQKKVRTVGDVSVNSLMAAKHSRSGNAPDKQDKVQPKPRYVCCALFSGFIIAWPPHIDQYFVENLHL